MISVPPDINFLFKKSQLLFFDLKRTSMETAAVSALHSASPHAGEHALFEMPYFVGFVNFLLVAVEMDIAYCDGNGAVSHTDFLHSSWKFNEELVCGGWMYEWMLDLYHLEDFFDASDIQTDLSQSFSFRDSEIHMLKKIRRKLHALQECMVYFIPL